MRPARTSGGEHLDARRGLDRDVAGGEGERVHQRLRDLVGVRGWRRGRSTTGSSSTRTSKRRVGSAGGSFGSQACQKVLPSTTRTRRTPRVGRAAGGASGAGGFSTSSGLPCRWIFSMVPRGMTRRPYGVSMRMERERLADDPAGDAIAVAHHDDVGRGGRAPPRAQRRRQRAPSRHGARSVNVSRRASCRKPPDRPPAPPAARRGRGRAARSPRPCWSGWSSRTRRNALAARLRRPWLGVQLAEHEVGVRALRLGGDRRLQDRLRLLRPVGVLGVASGRGRRARGSGSSALQPLDGVLEELDRVPELALLHVLLGGDHRLEGPAGLLRAVLGRRGLGAAAPRRPASPSAAGRRGSPPARGKCGAREARSASYGPRVRGLRRTS